MHTRKTTIEQERRREDRHPVIPFCITTDPDEADNVAEVLRNAHGDNVVHYRPAFGVHGASTLVQARDPRGYQANLASFTAFLRRVASSHD
ncbi:MAG: hypothetical protein EPN49_04500 [Rhodanobacter sp.]|nr:MAG: hypothetical protein EPN49_04500 [Rhodanobacter sp.]